MIQMTRRLWGEILVKLHEGNPLRQVSSGEQVQVFRGDVPFVAVDDAIAELTDARVRMSFPRYAPHVRRRRERRRRPAERSLDHFLRIPLLEEIETGRLLERVRSLPEVEWALRAPVLARPPTVSDLMSAQGYLLDATSGGVGAKLAWSVTGGNGDDVRICLCDLYCHENHDDLDITVLGTLPIVPSTYVLGTFPLPVSSDEARHGTMVAGVLVSQDDTHGTKGIAYRATLALSTVYGTGGLTGALDSALARDSTLLLRPGDVLLLEVQLTPAEIPRPLGPATPPLLPAEAHHDVFVAIQEALEDGVVVVECAGNGGASLVALPSADGSLPNPVWDPNVDSGAVLVGAGHAGAMGVATGTPCSRHAQSNYGKRVDCQGWGENVATTTGEATSNADADLYYGGLNASYTKSFGGTSSAAAVVAGVVASIQGVAREACGTAWAGTYLRTLLQNDAFGTPQVHLLNETGANEKRIGPLPDLGKLLPRLSTYPDIFLRDSLSDDGTVPSAVIEAASPDIIVRRAQLVGDPSTAFGAATWNNDSSSEVPLPGSDNFVYARVKNRGNANDDVIVRVYWAEASTFLEPSDWHFLGEQPLDGIVPNKVRVTPAFLWPAADVSAEGASLIAVAISKTQASAFPEDFETTEAFQTYVREHNEIAYRSFVVASVASAVRTAQRRFHMRRYVRRWVPGPQPLGPCGLAIRTDLPAGSQIQLSATGTPPLPPFVVDSQKDFEVLDLPVPEDAPLTVDVSMTLPVGADGIYRVRFQQLEGDSLAGTVTLVVQASALV
jgi:hypothetical protein